MAKSKRKKARSQPSKRFPFLRRLVDIVMPVYGRPDLVRKALTSLKATAGDLDYQLIVVDDCSPENTRQELDEIYKTELPDGTKVIRNRENYGFPITANRGVQGGGSKYIILFNTDIELRPGCLQAMVNTCQADEKVGVVGARLVFAPDSAAPANNRRYADEDGVIQHAGIAFSALHGPNHIFIGWPARHPKVMIEREMQSVTGALMLVRRATWDAIAGMHIKGDPSIGAFNHVYGRGTYEDVELCIAARLLGYKVIYQPKALASHHAGASAMSYEQSGFPVQRNGAIFYARCGQAIVADEYFLW